MVSYWQVMIPVTTDMNPGIVVLTLKRITDTWTHELENYAELSNHKANIDHKFFAKRRMLTKKIIVFRNHQVVITHQWLQDNSS